MQMYDLLARSGSISTIISFLSSASLAFDSSKRSGPEECVISRISSSLPHPQPTPPPPPPLHSTQGPSVTHSASMQSPAGASFSISCRLLIRPTLWCSRPHGVWRMPFGPCRWLLRRPRGQSGRTERWKRLR